MSPKKTSKPSAGKSPARRKAAKGFTAEERDAMKERARELKATRGGQKGDGESEILAKLAAMPESDRVIGTRLHSIIKAAAPTLAPRLWYGMPAYTRGGKVLCFFQAAKKFNTRYASVGFTDVATLDDGPVWPVAYAVTQLTADEEARIGELVKRAVKDT